MAEDPEAAADGLSGFTVFAASPREDVAYAKVFWNSLSLQPPLESRLVSGDITQRLRVAPAVGSDRCRCRLSSADKKARQKEIAFEMKMKAEQKAVYLEKAKKRKEILVLIQQRREQSIQVSVCWGWGGGEALCVWGEWWGGGGSEQEARSE
uniref:Cilia- and flagella-associated protein HOATZ n=1 Tax=Callorhinchus milii TaxID=7868 RepID=A0A4W3HN40_CALMI